MSGAPLAASFSSLPEESAVAPTAVYLHPGQVAAFAEPARITTVLGSCVSVCLFDARRGFGGMNHFVLPDLEAPHAPFARYAGPALEDLLQRLRGLGARRGDLQAKLFGGASRAAAVSGEVSVGARNVEAARTLLARRGIAVVAEDVGGPRGRKVLFETDGGAAWVRLLGEPA